MPSAGNSIAPASLLILATVHKQPLRHLMATELLSAAGRHWVALKTQRITNNMRMQAYEPTCKACAGTRNDTHLYVKNTCMPCYAHGVIAADAARAVRLASGVLGMARLPTRVYLTLW